jgi:hypothetical protein
MYQRTPLTPTTATVDSEESASIATCCYVLAITSIGQAMVLGYSLHPQRALIFICVAAGLVALGLFPKPVGRLSALAGQLSRPLLILAILAGMVCLVFMRAFARNSPNHSTFVSFVLAILLMTLSLIVLLGRGNRLRKTSFVLCLITFFLLGVRHLRSNSDPRIDVYVYQRQGCRALLAGQDPYSMQLPAMYDPRLHFYPPGSVVDGKTQFGYFYPPLSLLLDVPGYLAGDVRYSLLAAVTLAALIIAYCRPGALSFGPALLLLFTPGLLHILENGWIEPFMLLLIAASVYCCLRRQWNRAAVCIGLLLASKQYTLFMVPAIALLAPRPASRGQIAKLIVLACGIAAIVTIPFVLWNPHAFFYSLSSVYLGMLRMDSMSFLPIIFKKTGWKPTLLVPIAAAVPAIVLICKYAPRTPGGFAASVSLILMCVFAFGTQAFGNYYFLTAACLCIALAGGAERGRQNVE